MLTKTPLHRQHRHAQTVLRGGSTDKIIMLNNTIIHRSQQQTNSRGQNKIVVVKRPA